MQVTVLSWNLQFRPGETGRPARHRRIAETIATHRPEVVCLQEVAPVQQEVLEQAMPDYRWYHCARAAGGSERVLLGHPTGNVTVTGQRVLWLSDTPHRRSRGWDARHPRCAVTADVTFGALRLATCATHFDHRGQRSRRRSAHLIAEWARASRRAHRLPVVGGDLNIPPSHPDHRILGEVLVDSRGRCADPRGPAATWHGIGGVLRRRIDYILADPGFTVRRHRTLPHPPGRRHPSDHHAVLAELVHA